MDFLHALNLGFLLVVAFFTFYVLSVPSHHLSVRDELVYRAVTGRAFSVDYAFNSGCERFVKEFRSCCVSCSSLCDSVPRLVDVLRGECWCSCVGDGSKKSDWVRGSIK